MVAGRGPVMCWVEALLVHGRPIHRVDMSRYNHAWVLWRDVVIFDITVTASPIDIARYYEVGQIEWGKSTEYTHRDSNSEPPASQADALSIWALGA